MSRRALVAVALLGWFGLHGAARAHESQPATLELRELGTDRYDLTWRAPTYFGARHPAGLELPATWTTVAGPTSAPLPDSEVSRRVVTVGAGGVDGAVIRFPRLDLTTTEVFVRLVRLDGTATTLLARPARPFVELHGDRAWFVVAGEYTALGVHHILLGIDHLSFVVGLLLIVRGRVSLLKTITAFTVAHSITLGIATLGHARVAQAPLNATIALSILFLGPEIVRAWRGQTSLTIRYPWGVAFGFGLLHGFGFASGLATAGMTRAELPIALCSFNVGVELGQLAFIALALALTRAWRVLEVRWPRWAELAPAYVVGSLGAFWSLQRTAVLIAGLR